MLVELKTGETYNGHLVNCDSWMNINLREVIITSKDGDQFWKVPEAYIRGNTVKYIRIPDEIIDMVKAEPVKKKSTDFRARGRGRGAFGERGRGGFGGDRGRGGAGAARGGRGRGGPPAGAGRA